MQIEDGFAVFPKTTLSKDLANAAKKIVKLRVGDGIVSGKGFMGTILKPNDSVEFPAIIQFATNREILDPISRYLGTVPSLTSIKLLYSIPKNTKELSHSQLYHCDNSSSKVVKVFVPVFDVDLDNGPFMFLPKNFSDKIIARLNYGSILSSSHLDDGILFCGDR